MLLVPGLRERHYLYREETFERGEQGSEKDFRVPDATVITRPVHTRSDYSVGLAFGIL
jgi:hypothetical protein